MLNKQFIFLFCFLFVFLLSSSCQSDYMTPKQLIGESKTSVVKLIFQHSKKTKHNEIIILSWNSNGSIISHSYLSIEEALRDTESLLNKNIWGIDFRRKFSLFPNKEEFILLHFHNNIVIKAEYKTWHHK